MVTGSDVSGRKEEQDNNGMVLKQQGQLNVWTGCTSVVYRLIQVHIELTKALERLKLAEYLNTV
jgi:hypothetical protein